MRSKKIVKRVGLPCDVFFVESSQNIFFSHIRCTATENAPIKPCFDLSKNRLTILIHT